MSSPASSRVRVLLVDDHPVVLAGLRHILEHGAQLVMIGESESGRNAIRLTGELRPDVVLMDISMPDMNGIEVTREIKARFPDARVLVVSAHSDAEYVTGALEAGADGYLLKRCQPQELRAGISQVHAGERVIHQSLVHILVRRVAGSTPARETLSEREREVLQRMTEGATSKEIAVQLGLRPKTVENHRARILDKLGAANSAAAVHTALAEGLVAPVGSGNGHGVDAPPPRTEAVPDRRCVTRMPVNIRRLARHSPSHG